MDDRIAMRLVEAIEQITKTSLKNDEMLLDTINALTTEVNTLTGMTDKLTHRVAYLEEKLKDSYDTKVM